MHLIHCKWLWEAVAKAILQFCMAAGVQKKPHRECSWCNNKLSSRTISFPCPRIYDWWVFPLLTNTQSELNRFGNYVTRSPPGFCNCDKKAEFMARMPRRWHFDVAVTSERSLEWMTNSCGDPNARGIYEKIHKTNYSVRRHAGVLLSAPQ